MHVRLRRAGLVVEINSSSVALIVTQSTLIIVNPQIKGNITLIIEDFDLRSCSFCLLQIRDLDFRPCRRRLNDRFVPVDYMWSGGSIQS